MPFWLVFYDLTFLAPAPLIMASAEFGVIQNVLLRYIDLCKTFLITIIGFFI
jgi:hypothetical protein